MTFTENIASYLMSLTVRSALITTTPGSIVEPSISLPEVSSIETPDFAYTKLHLVVPCGIVVTSPSLSKPRK